MNNGSVDSLKVCVRCGAGAKARQIREIADCDIPVAAAIDRVDQCVAFFGVSSSVGDLPGNARPGLIAQAVHAALEEPPPPGADRVRADPQTTRNFQDGVTLSAFQNDP
jgi:hypothetical protein